MNPDTLWAALALVLIIEGLFPLLYPAGWRRIFMQLLQLSDDQIRFFAVASILSGLLMIWFLAP